MTDRISRRAIPCALLVTTSLSFPSLALAAIPAPKFIDTIDDHGVDRVNALPFLSIEEGGIGSGPGRVSMQRIYAEGAGFLDNWTGGLYDVTVGGTTKKYIQFAGVSDTFTGSGTTWTSDKSDGATLTTGGPGWIYTARDGTTIAFRETYGERTFNCPGAVARTCRPPVTITRPDGMKFTLGWENADICVDLPGEPCGREYIYNRLESVTSSAGYSLSITYLSDSAYAQMPSTDPWFKRSTVTFTNVANPPNPLPSISYSYPSSTETDVTDPAGRTWVYTTDASAQLTGLKRPGIC
jgi:hypothetical protein